MVFKNQNGIDLTAAIRCISSKEAVEAAPTAVAEAKDEEKNTHIHLILLFFNYPNESNQTCLLRMNLILLFINGRLYLDTYLRTLYTI